MLEAVSETKWKFDGRFVTGPTGSHEAVSRILAAVLQAMIAGNGGIVPQERIQNADSGRRLTSGCLKVHVNRLRNILESVGLSRDTIQAIRHYGYRITVLPEPEAKKVRLELDGGQWDNLVAVMKGVEAVSPGAIDRCGLGALIDVG